MFKLIKFWSSKHVSSFELCCILNDPIVAAKNSRWDLQAWTCAFCRTFGPWSLTKRVMCLSRRTCVLARLTSLHKMQVSRKQYLMLTTASYLKKWICFHIAIWISLYIICALGCLRAFMYPIRPPVKTIPPYKKLM